MSDIDRLISAYHADGGLIREAEALTGTPVTLDNYRYALHYIFNKYEKDCSILDVGAFVGVFVDLLRKNGYDDVHGIEKNRHFVDIARNRGHPVELMDGKHADINKRFDIITCIQVFHNDFNQAKSIINGEMIAVIKNLRNMLKEDGVIFISAYIPLPLRGIRESGLINIYPDYSRRTGTYIFKNDRQQINL